MKIDNRFSEIDNRSCGSDGIALSARPVGDVLQGAAADCNSAVETAHFHQKIKALSQSHAIDNTPGHSANGPGTLTTSYRGPFDTYDTDCDARPTAAAIVALCLFAGVAVACGVALWVVV